MKDLEILGDCYEWLYSEEGQREMNKPCPAEYPTDEEMKAMAEYYGEA